MCNAIEDSGARTRLMSVIGPETGAYYAQKKSANCL